MIMCKCLLFANEVIFQIPNSRHLATLKRNGDFHDWCLQVYNWIHWSRVKIMHSRRESNHLTIHVVVTTVLSIFLIQDALGNLTTLDACSILCPSYPLTPDRDLNHLGPKKPTWRTHVKPMITGCSVHRSPRFFLPWIFSGSSRQHSGVGWYCWWKKSGERYGQYPMIHKVFYTSQVVVGGFFHQQYFRSFIMHCYILTPKKNSLVDVTLQGTTSNISHLKKRKILFKCPLKGDMLVPKTVLFVSKSGTPTKIVWTVDSNFETCSFARRLFFLP